MGGKWIRVNRKPCKDLRYRVEGLYEGNSYEFRVFAENVYGRSDASDESSLCQTKPSFKKKAARTTYKSKPCLTKYLVTILFHEKY